MVRVEETHDPAKRSLFQEIEDNSKWFKQLANDFKAKHLQVEEAIKLAKDRPEWRGISSALRSRAKKGVASKSGRASRRGGAASMTSS